MDIALQKNVLDVIFIIEGIYLVIRQCMICGKNFDTKDSSNRAKTCSKKCSLERRRAYDRKRNRRPDRREYNARYQDQHPEKYDKDKREKETPGLKEAKKIVRQNANYQCELTGWKGPNNVHHLNGYVCFPDQRADLNNLIVLETSVHKHFHSIYGKGNNTIEQFDEFVCDWFPLQVDNFRMNKYKYLPQHTYNT